MAMKMRCVLLTQQSIKDLQTLSTPRGLNVSTAIRLAINNWIRRERQIARAFTEKR